MGAMDRFLNAMRLNSDDEDDDYYDEDDFYDEDEEYEEDDYEPGRRPFFRNRRDRDLDFDDNDEDDFEDEDEGGSAFNVRRGSSRSDYNSKVTPMRASRRNAGGSANSSMEVCVIKPISVEDAREITETLIANRTVVLNLEGLDLEIAQRIIDFTSGSCYAISGNLQKISNYIFIVTPSHVDISGDYQDIMSAFGGSSLQMDI
ncbi:MAG: cell division protein SepF [Lachnospiraceae bacterium]|nr:cell division protein SepF [Lachnospiraceae bacterium]